MKQRIDVYLSILILPGHIFLPSVHLKLAYSCKFQYQLYLRILTEWVQNNNIYSLTDQHIYETWGIYEKF